jgi:DNA-directed RNA polymerase I subunit RPA43
MVDMSKGRYRCWKCCPKVLECFQCMGLGVVESSRTQTQKPIPAVSKSQLGRLNPTAAPYCAMSTTMSRTQVKESPEAKSLEPHKAKKRKHADEPEEPMTKEKKKHKRPRTEGNDHGVLNLGPSIKKSKEEKKKKKKKKLRSPPVLAKRPISTSPSVDDVPDSAAVIVGGSERQATLEDHTTSLHSPSPSVIDDTTPSPFHSVCLSLYVPLSAISLSPATALASLQAEHLSPLLLTYYPPARGIVLAFTDTVLSSTRPQPSNPPPGSASLQPSTSILASCADEYGVSYLWLTTTFLVFRPTPAQILSGWINVCSDGFVGLLSYNYFQTGVARNRIPKDWRWVGPGGDPTQARKRSMRSKAKKVRIRPPDSEEDVDMDADNIQTTLVDPEDWTEDDYDGTGYFVTADGSRVKGTLQFRVVDADVVPGHHRDVWTLQIEGTLLSPDDEAAVVEEERAQTDKLKTRGKVAGRGASITADIAMMSGGLGAEDRRRTASVSQTPVPHSARR